MSPSRLLVAAVLTALPLSAVLAADAPSTTLTPEQAAAVRAADQHHAEVIGQQGLDLVRLNADHEAALATVDAGDRASARDREAKLGGWTTPALAWMVVACFGAVLSLKLAGWVGPGDGITNDLITSLRDALMLVLAYYFGSSRGSAAKDATIRAQVEAAQVPPAG